MTFTGTVNRIDETRFFGFIKPDIRDGTKHVFFHGSELRGGLKMSPQLLEMRVRFHRTTTPKGFMALNVFALDEEPAAAPAKDSKFEASQGK